MEDVRIHRLLGHHYDGEPFSFKMDLKNGRCTNEEIYELLTRGYIESVNTNIPYDIRYRITAKGKDFLR